MADIHELLDCPVSNLENTAQVPTVTPSATLAEVLKVLQQSDVGAVIVLDSGKVQGIFTERDFLRKICGKNLDLGHERIANHMTSSPYSVNPNDPIASVLLRMHMGGFRHMLIVDEEDRLLSVVSPREIVSFLLGAYRE